MPLYAKFFKEIFSKKKTIEHNETIALTRESSAIIKKPLPRLRDPGSFSIPCVIGSETIDKAMCDLGASVSLLPLSLFKRMRIGELKPTEMSLKLADHSTIQPVGFVEAIPVKIEGIYIPADFMVFDNEEDPDVRILLGRPFLATAGAIIDVKNGRIGFQVSDEMVGFELENIMKGPALYSSCMIKDNDVKERFLASSTQYDLFDPMKGFENFTYEFLSSITFKKDRLNFDNPNHRVSFRLLNIDYEMSLENFCLDMGFVNAGFIHNS